MYFLNYTKDPLDSHTLHNSSEGRIRYMAFLAGNDNWCLLLPAPFLVRSTREKVRDCTAGMVYDVWHTQEIPGSPGVFLVYVLPIYFSGVRRSSQDSPKLWSVVAQAMCPRRNGC